jgi:orotate phosphoribosyltransferase
MTRNDAPEPRETERTLLNAVAASWGHFRYESGHHGDLWLDLDALFLDARQIRDWTMALARQAALCRPELVCGPLTGGAFVAHALAVELDAGFVFAERFVSVGGAVRYRIPQSLREAVRGRRVLLVDDVVNAGTALRSTLADLLDCAAELAGLGSLITLGEAASQTAEQRGVPLFALASLERGMWAPEACPLCRAGTPLVDLTMTGTKSFIRSVER